jgi:hypothetical protein
MAVVCELALLSNYAELSYAYSGSVRLEKRVLTSGFVGEIRFRNSLHFFFLGRLRRI